MNNKLKSMIAGTLVATAAANTLSLESLTNVVANDNQDKNVIMLIADGMSTEALTLARHVKGSDLAMDEIATGAVITSWAKGPITDSAPGGTAYSTGEKTNNKYVGTSVHDTPLATMIEGAESIGKATGIIATSEITHATPADFSAHTNDRSQYNSILRQQMNLDLEVALGGGFNKPSGFKDVEDFNSYYNERVEELAAEGFDFVQTRDELLAYEGEKLWGSFASADLKYDYDRQADEDTVEPTLAEMTEKAIEVLDKDEDGFFLMVEGSKVDWAAHANNTVGIVSDILAFDDAVAEAVEFAKEDGNTIVVVTTDHGNSGITIGSDYYNQNVGSPTRATYEATTNQLKAAKITEERFNELVADATDAQIMSLVKEYYNFDLTNEELMVVKDQGIREVIARRVGIGYTTGGHTGEQVYLGVYAPKGTKLLEGVVDNTEVSEYMQEMLFGEALLKELTSKLFIEGATALNKLEDTTAVLDNSISYAPKVIIEKLGNTIELELYTNNYTLNGESFELDSVMPYMSKQGKYYIPQQLIDLINELNEVKSNDSVTGEFMTDAGSDSVSEEEVITEELISDAIEKEQSNEVIDTNQVIKDEVITEEVTSDIVVEEELDEEMVTDEVIEDGVTTEEVINTDLVNNEEVITGGNN
ncbi:alkaline phosphatase [Turicibacter sp. TJ11]|uniref:alkaline phosphatase n=1 Tax=Turicibacter sp. TJ11 TaxID=2806443 RepID=UPI001F199154|nr:alkaline phosphatase [Turicibacter sp. TJ11]